ncbi:MAG TPA: hypothetical protein VHV77_09515, partial [Pirellulales bacterium]|nr:hypothetical protein [Pirellulales bacterium]
TSNHWEPYVLGVSGPVRIDGNGDARFSSPQEHAARLIDSAGDNLERLIESLAAYDDAVSVQAASLLRRRGIEPNGERLNILLQTAAPSVERGFRAYGGARAESLRAAGGTTPAK